MQFVSLITHKPINSKLSISTIQTKRALVFFFFPPQESRLTFSTTKRKAPTSFGANALKNAREDVLVARNAKPRAVGELENFLNMVKQWLKQRVFEKGNVDDKSLALFTNIHCQVTLWDIFWDVIVLSMTK